MIMKINTRKSATVLVTAVTLMLVPGLVGQEVAGAVAAEASTTPPIMLAQTGFDITWPVILGIAALLLGIALVGWAFLRNPDRRSEAHGESNNDHQHH
ncbi:LPXTG cell wall anchor domain-containing protein [Nakamurella silvestris]|nr:LPXTG cell wall anchor domain-containing protein [Nakamurella silvestris]